MQNSENKVEAGDNRNLKKFYNLLERIESLIILTHKLKSDNEELQKKVFTLEEKTDLLVSDDRKTELERELKLLENENKTLKEKEKAIKTKIERLAVKLDEIHL